MFVVYAENQNPSYSFCKENEKWKIFKATIQGVLENKRNCSKGKNIFCPLEIDSME